MSFRLATLKHFSAISMCIYIWQYTCVHGGIFKLLGKGTFAKEDNIFEGVIFFLLAKEYCIFRKSHQTVGNQQTRK